MVLLVLALGNRAGVLVGLIHVIYVFKKKILCRRKDEEASERVDSYQEIFLE